LPGPITPPDTTSPAATPPAATPATEPTAAPGGSPDAVLAEIRRIVVEVIGEDYVSELDVERDTRFRDDLDVESIEFVALGEALRARYGERIRLAQWIGDMEVDEIIAMTVGQLVDHIVASLR
jgi:acyl carrier protein